MTRLVFPLSDVLTLAPMSKHAIADTIGGDDFCQVLALLDPQPGGTLHAQLAAGVAAGMAQCVIDLDPQAMELIIAGDAR